MAALPAHAIREDLAHEVVRAVSDVLGPTSSMIALHEPEFTGNEWDYVKECIDTGWVSSVGSYVDRFEQGLAEFTGCTYAVATANGTAALHMCLLAAGVQPGDEVLMPALTFVATANAAAYLRALPHFVDSESVSLGVDAKRLEDYLRDIAQLSEGRCVNRVTGATIRCLVVMHAFGHPADLDALCALAQRWKLVLVEDAAESLGSYYHGRHTGSFGHMAALSFNGNKVVTTGGGGAVLTNDLSIARRVKHLTTTARLSHRWNFSHDEVGYNFRLPNLNAALGCAQLERLPSMLERKRMLAHAYSQRMLSVPGARFLVEPEGTRSNFWLNAIVLDDPDETQRDATLAALNDAGYMSRPVWTLMHKLPMYASCPRMPLEVALRLEASVINVPSSPRLAREPARSS